MKMNKFVPKHFIVLGTVTLALSACGFLGGSDGGSSDGAKPKPDDKSTTSPTPDSAPSQTDSSLPLVAIPLEELIKNLGAKDFKPSDLSERALASMIQEVENLSGSQIMKIGIETSQGSQTCNLYGSGGAGSLVRLLSDLSFDNMHAEFIDGFKESVVEIDGIPHTKKRITNLRSFATSGYAESSSKTDFNHQILETQYFAGGTSDQLVQGLIQTSANTQLNCARVYLKLTREIKSSCSMSARGGGYVNQENVTWNEVHTPNQFAYKSAYSSLIVNNPKESSEDVVEHTQLTIDTVSVNRSTRSSKSDKQTSTMATVKLQDLAYGQYGSCAVISK